MFRCFVLSRSTEQIAETAVTAYYNENNKHAAEWLRNLIADGLIPYGHVDDRSIADVRPGDLAGYTQCHFFAGIGGWGLALRLAGWPDERPIWTGSCPCQPFSVAGKGAGFDDPRDLFPTWFGLVRACRPAVVMGEQVARTAGAVWFARTRSSLEGIGYAARGVVVPACAVEAPHERERLWFVAHPHAIPAVARGPGVTGEGADRRHVDRGLIGSALADTPEIGKREPHDDPGAVARARARDCVGGPSLRHGKGALADAHSIEPEQRGAAGDMAGPAIAVEGEGCERQRGGASARYCCEGNGSPGFMGNADRDGQQARAVASARNGQGVGGDVRQEFPAAAGTSDGFWRGADWLHCADGKQRRLAPGIALLAHGLRPRDVAGSLAGFGNAIVPQVAAEIIAAFADTRPWDGRTVGVSAEELLQ